MPKAVDSSSIITNDWSVGHLADQLGLDVQMLAGLLSDSPDQGSLNSTADAVAAFHRHWKMTTAELARLVGDNPSLRSFIMGYGAELKLRQDFFENRAEFTGLRKEDDHDRERKGDLTVTYRGQEFVIEVKSLQTNSMKWNVDDGLMKCNYQCDASDSRYVNFKSGQTHMTTSLLRGEFDILAVCLFPLTHEWDFLFALNADLCSPSRATLKDPGGQNHGRPLSSDELSQLVKGTQSITFSDGWKASPDIFFGRPELAMDMLLKDRPSGVDGPNVVSDEQKRIQSEDKAKRRARTREKAEKARREALRSLGAWSAPGSS